MITIIISINKIRMFNWLKTIEISDSNPYRWKKADTII